MVRKNNTLVDSLKYFSYVDRASLPGGSALCIVHPLSSRARPLPGRPVRPGENQHLNSVKIEVAGRPMDSGSASEALLRSLSEMPEIPENHLSVLSPRVSLLC
jgi:hypothetical protein